jgi:nicotinamidase-related amidase
MKKILLVIDLQHSFEHSENPKAAEYCLTHRTDYDRVIFTYFRNVPNSNFVKHLKWKECFDTSESDLLVQIDNSVTEVKNGYAFRNISKYCAKEDTIDLIGCDADACVLATAFELWDQGYHFRILSEYIDTTATSFTKSDVLRLMKRNFGDCLIE